MKYSWIHREEVLYWHDILQNNSNVNISNESGIHLSQVNRILDKRYNKKLSA